MKKLKYFAIATMMLLSMSACDIEEEFKTELEQGVVYNTKAGYDGLINACYENLYYLYGKEDGIPMMEMGDLWQNGSATGSAWKECVNNYDWNTECNVNKVVWQALYSIIAYCNTAIYYQDQCPEYSGESIKPKVAEAYFMRAFAYFHVVEQWGGVTLTTSSMAEDGIRVAAYRNTEEEIYDQIIADLEFAYNNLPATQGEERGRASKDAAAAMLVKAWMQRSRLERDLQENPDGKSKWMSKISESGTVKYTAAQCAENALQYAKELFANKQYHSLYESTDEMSGNAQEWDGENNKSNKEFLFLEAIDHVNGYNPEGWNRGRTRQYYMMAISSAAADFGINDQGVRYGRANTSRVHPTLWLLNDCFDPKPGEGDVANTVYTDDKDRETTPDTRFADSFYYKYFISSGSYTVSYNNWKSYGKDTAYYLDAVATNKPTRYTITGNIKTATELRESLPGMSYYADQGTISADFPIEMEDKPAALGCYVPNFPVDSTWASQKKYLVAGLPSLDGKKNTGVFTYFQESGATASSSYYRSLSPSLKKFSPFKYCYTNQQVLCDFPIIRLTDIYLLAAEACILKGTPNEGLEYLNTVRRHAALAKNAKKIEVGADCMTIDYLAKERARELCGENWRWYDLKRMGLLTAEYLNSDRKNVYGQPYQTKWRVRPIPQALLDQISNPDEFGTNGY